VLVLTREELQSVVLVLPGGVQVRVQVVEVRHDGRVKLGVEAPREVGVWRQERLPMTDARRQGVGRGG
jgi:carbon storage regulator CsrA